MLKNNKGISMITMGMTVLILVIILTTLVYTAMTNFKVKKLNDLYTDLKTLSDEVAAYYLENNKLPVSSEYQEIYEGDALEDNISFVTKDGVFSGQDSLLNPNDYDSSDEIGKAVYYYLDVDVFENITLTNTGRYIINEQSHTIYYVNGVTVNGTTYHALQLKYTDVEYRNRQPVVNISAQPVYLPMGEKTLDLRDYLGFAAADGSAATPKSIKYTVTTSGSDQYFYVKDGKITSTNNSNVMPTPFKINVEAESYGSTQVVSTDLTVYLTNIAVWDVENINSKVEKINLYKGEEFTAYVEVTSNPEKIEIKTKGDNSNVIEPLIGISETRLNGKTLYPLTIKGKNEGKVTLVVSENEGNAFQEITVSVYSMTFKSPRLAEDGALILPSVNEKEEVKLIINDFFDISAVGNDVMWESSNSDIVTVTTDEGLKTTVTAVGYGEKVNINCKVKVDGSFIKELSIPVTVVEPVVENIEN